MFLLRRNFQNEVNFSNITLKKIQYFCLISSLAIKPSTHPAFSVRMTLSVEKIDMWVAPNVHDGQKRERFLDFSKRGKQTKRWWMQQQGTSSLCSFMGIWVQNRKNNRVYYRTKFVQLLQRWERLLKTLKLLPAMFEICSSAFFAVSAISKKIMLQIEKRLIEGLKLRFVFITWKR